MNNRKLKIVYLLAVVVALAMIFSAIGTIQFSQEYRPTKKTALPDISDTGSSSSTNYRVTFAESGLPSGMNWSVQLGNYFAGSNSTAIGFSVPDGTYSYFAYYEGYSGYIFHGRVTVSGAPVSISLAFHSVTFGNTGAHNGFGWEIQISR